MSRVHGCYKTLRIQPSTRTDATSGLDTSTSRIQRNWIGNWTGFKKNILHLTFRYRFPIFVFDNEAMSCSDDPFLVYDGASTARLPLVFLVPGVTFSQSHQPRKAPFPRGCAAYNSLELLQKLYSQWLNSVIVVLHILFRMFRMEIVFYVDIKHQLAPLENPPKRSLFFSCAQSGYIFCQMFSPGLEDSI